MKVISATDAARSFADLINRVRYQGEEFEIIRGGERVARVTPIVAARALTAQEFADLVRNLPPLDVEFGLELADARREDGRREDGAPWER